MLQQAGYDVGAGCSQTIRGQDTESHVQGVPTGCQQVAVKRSEVRILKGDAMGMHCAI